MERTPTRRASLVRRLPRALLVALAVGLLGGGAIGFATAADGPGMVFALPAPMGGDEAQYTTDVPDEAPRRLDVFAPAPLLLPDGRYVSAARMRISQNQSTSDGEDWHVAFREASVDLGAGTVVASAFSTYWFRGSSGTSSPVPGADLDSAVVVNDLYSELRWEAGPVPCGSLNGLQGRTAPVGDRVWVAGCFADEDRRDFHVVGTEDVGGVTTLVLESEEVRLWFAGGIPYPVQMQIVAATPGPGAEGVWKLTGFIRGVVPLVPGDVPPDRIMPPIEFAPRTMLGPDATGILLPFTLAQAFEQARGQTQEFLDAYPEHYVAKATYLEEEPSAPGMAGPERWWRFVVRGEGEELHVAVRQPSRSDDVDLMRLWENGGQPDAGSVELEQEFSEPQTEACRPASMPTVASAALRWQALNGDGRPPTGYGFSLGCEQDASVVAHVDAGDADSESFTVSNEGTLPFIVPPEEVHEHSTGLVVLADGTVDHLWMLDSTTRGDAWTDVPAAPLAETGAEPPRPGPTSAWLPPPGPVAASITLVSVLAGLLYWLWPAIKAGPLGLFSRLQAPDLLEHPVRKELMQRIEAQPGLHYQDLVRAVGKGKGAIEHHLRKLQEGGLVKSIAAGGYTCFFPIAFDRRLTAAAPALKSSGARRVLAAIQANPGASATTIGAATGLSPAAVNHHLQRLGAAGLVDVLRNGRSLSLQPTALAGQVAAREAAAGA